MSEPVNFAVAASALASFLCAALLVLTAPQHGRFTMDWPGSIQKVHVQPTPRVGGAGIYIALLVAASLVSDREAVAILHTLLLAGLPALAVGLLEDMTKRVGVRIRLVATLASGLLACWVSGQSVGSLDVPGVDRLLAIPAVALLFTAFGVAGVSNAINIIDGFNGLASGASAIAACALAAIAIHAGDVPLAIAALVVAAALAGFWLVNFPWGKLFLGDGGAYFTGLALAWIAVLLPARNPEVSPWASLLVCGYPVIEAIYSIARRLRGRRSATLPDCAHLHSLVAQRIVRPRLGRASPRLEHAAVSSLMWICAAFPALLGIALYRHTPWLAMGAAGCVLLYHWLYRYVARL